MILNVGLKSSATAMAPGILTFRLVGDVLTGTDAGKYVHTVTRPGIGGKARPPAGRYQMLAPISHPLLGRVAIVVPLQEAIYTLTKLSSVAPNVLSGFTVAAPAPAGGFVRVTTDAAPAQAGAFVGVTGTIISPGAARAGNAIGGTAIGGTAIGPGAIRAGNAIGGTAIGGTAIGPGAAQAGAASFSPNQGFILTKDNVAAPNAVAVVSGFDELMDALESSGGAILEIPG
jgi:hypothetical protein